MIPAHIALFEWERSIPLSVKSSPLSLQSYQMFSNVCVCVCVRKSGFQVSHVTQKHIRNIFTYENWIFLCQQTYRDSSVFDVRWL